MERVSAGLALLCLLAGACEGNGPLFPQQSIESSSPPVGEEPTPPEPTPPEDVDAPLTPLTPLTPTPSQPSGDVAPPVDTVPPVVSRPDAGEIDTPPDAGAVVAPPRDVVADGPATLLSLLGVVGGDPRLGVCAGGVVVGVRTTANPSTEVFGQRLTFVEPICGTVLSDTAVSDPPSQPDDASGTVRVTRDDALVEWAVTDGFFGLPATEVPDPRLVWVAQPETVCPEATPVVVGLSGEYDPVAPDVPDTAAIRSLFIECAPLVVAPDGSAVVASAAGHQRVSNAESFASPGASSYRSACEGGAVTSQIQVHAGFWLDGFVLGCSTLRLD